MITVFGMRQPPFSLLLIHPHKAVLFDETSIFFDPLRNNRKTFKKTVQERLRLLFRYAYCVFEHVRAASVSNRKQNDFRLLPIDRAVATFFDRLVKYFRSNRRIKVAPLLIIFD